VREDWGATASNEDLGGGDLLAGGLHPEHPLVHEGDVVCDKKKKKNIVSREVIIFTLSLVVEP
jgi:isopentenyl phosphate kinase